MNLLSCTQASEGKIGVGQQLDSEMHATYKGSPSQLSCPLLPWHQLTIIRHKLPEGEIVKSKLDIHLSRGEMGGAPPKPVALAL